MIWYDVMWCDVLWCDIIWCDMMWCDVVWYGVMWCETQGRTKGGKGWQGEEIKICVGVGAGVYSISTIACSYSYSIYSY